MGTIQIEFSQIVTIILIVGFVIVAMKNFEYRKRLHDQKNENLKDQIIADLIKEMNK